MGGAVVTFDMSGLGAAIGVGATPRTCTDVEGRKLRRSELAQWNDTARCRRVGGADGRGVVMLCDEPLAVVGQSRSGLVHTGPAGGHFEMVRFAVGGLAGSGGCHGVVTSGAKHGGTQGDTLRRFLQVGGRGGTGWDG